MNNKVKIDDLFRNKLSGLTEEPPSDIWNNIQDQLILRRRKMRTAIYRWTAVAAILVLALISGWYFDILSYERIPETAEIENIKQEEKNISADKYAGKNLAASKDTESVVEKSESLSTAAISGKKFFSGTSGEAGGGQGSGIQRIIISDYSEAVSGETGIDTKRRIAMEKIRNIRRTSLQEDYPLALAGKTDGTRTSSPDQVQKREMVAVNDIPVYKELKSKKEWKMGIEVSPGYSSYSSNHDPVYASNMTYPSSQINGNVCGGVSVQYKTGRKWSVESGVYYARNVQKSESTSQLFASNYDNEIPELSTEKLYFNPEVDVQGNRIAMKGIAGIIELEKIPEGAEIAGTFERTVSNPNALLTRGEFSQAFDFIEIPLLLRYLIINSKLDIELVGGVSAGMIVGNDAFLNNEYGKQKIGKTRDISTMNISGTLGLGLDYPLTEHISLALEPRVNYYLNSINNNPDVDFRPYRIGVYTGVYYEF